MSDFQIVQATDNLREIDNISEVGAIASYSRHLSKRETDQIVSGFQMQSYEMVTSFVWTKSSGILRKELAKLGMDFIGEILGRPDLTEDSAPQEISESEAINLAENLGMVSSTEAMRLRQAQSLVDHFNNLNEEEVADESVSMAREEAISCLKACIKNILAVPKIEFAEQFARFRRDLEQRPFQPDEALVENLETAPQFYRKTTLSFLLSSIRTATGAQLQNALHNLNLILPVIWKGLRKTELWQVGNLYAEMHSNGQQVAVSGLKKALLKVQGFDYVPETTRSSTFTKSASKLLAAHEGLNNFYTEAPAALELSKLGSSIPMPAFQVCSTAVIASYLGNTWGNAWSAEGYLVSILNNFSKEKWEFYFNECLPVDSTILYKLRSSKPYDRWVSLSQTYRFDLLDIKNPQTKAVVDFTFSNQRTRFSSQVDFLLSRATRG